MIGFPTCDPCAGSPAAWTRHRFGAANIREPTMRELPADWMALCAVVVLLGLKHGVDADHLAAIDGLTRYNSRLQRGFARFCGALFSVGHGVIVLAIAVLLGLASSTWEAPASLE